jgi:hypothetical protein
MKASSDGRLMSTVLGQNAETASSCSRSRNSGVYRSIDPPLSALLRDAKTFGQLVFHKPIFTIHCHRLPAAGVRMFLAAALYCRAAYPGGSIRGAEQSQIRRILYWRSPPLFGETMNVSSNLKSYIDEARIELRRAHGTMTNEDLRAAEQRKQAVALEDFIASRLGNHLAFVLLHLDIISNGETSRVRFSCEGKEFHLLSITQEIWQLSVIADTRGATDRHSCSASPDFSSVYQPRAAYSSQGAA